MNPTDWDEIARKFGGTADDWRKAAEKLGAAADKLAATPGYVGPEKPVGTGAIDWAGILRGRESPWGSAAEGAQAGAGGGRAPKAPRAPKTPKGGSVAPPPKNLGDALRAGWARQAERDSSPSLVDAMRASMSGKPLVVPPEISGGLAGAMANLGKAPEPESPAPAPSSPGRVGRILGGTLRQADRLLGGTRVGRVMSQAAGAFGGRRAAGLKLGAGLGRAGAAARAAGFGGLGAGLSGAGAVASAVAAPVAVVAGLVELGKAVHGTTSALLDAQERLAHASGGMAAVMAERNARDVMRDANQGNTQAASARDLAQAEGDLKDEAAKIDTFVTVIKNRGLAVIEQMLADILKPVAQIAEKLTKWIEGDPKDEGVPAMLRRIADETAAARARGDAGFMRPDVRDFRP